MPVQKFKVGDMVVIRKTADAASKSWVNAHPAYGQAMDLYDGQITKIKEAPTYPWYYIEADGGRWVWHEDFLSLYVSSTITAAPLVISHQDDGCKCSRCGDFVPYVNPDLGFVCFTCRRRP